MACGWRNGFRVMIDSKYLADVVLQEARLLAHSVTFNEAPNLTPEEKFAREVAQFPLPDCEAIASVIEEIFWASLLKEEGRPCRPRLVYFPRQGEKYRSLSYQRRTRQAGAALVI